MRRIAWILLIMLLAASAPAAVFAREPVDETPTFDVSAQAAALLPEFRGDLQYNGNWNRYSLAATIDPQARTLAGEQRLDYTNRDTVPLDRLYFHLYPNLSDFGGALDMRAVRVNGHAVAPAYELGRYLLRVDLPRPLAPGETTSVTLDFVTRAPQNASSWLYGAFNKERGVLALASATPIAAIVRAGMWDIGRPDPQGDFVNSETSLYDVTLTAPADWSMVTTGVAVDQREANGVRTTRFVSGPQRDFTIVLTQLAHVSAEVDGTRVNSYYSAGSATGGQQALDIAVNAMRIFNRRYGRYPLAELDVIETDLTTFYGVEYPGLVMIEHSLYRQPAMLESIVAHEVAHQWWYSIVGNDVQRESWMDEALASYSQVIYQEEMHGAQAAQHELDQFRQRYRRARAAGLDAPAEQSNSNFHGNYVSIVYGKAVLFFQAMRVQIGEQAFDQFLHRYAANHRYGFAGGANMLADANDACGCNLDALYHDWITSVVPLQIP
jgi:aminopeptidase N